MSINQAEAVIQAQLNLIEYYDQIPSNDVMDWKGLFKDNRAALQYDLAQLTTHKDGNDE